MTYNQPIQGVNSVSEYLASSLPWVTSSIAVTGSVTRHDFPSVTSWINIKNTSPSGVLEIGVTQYGTLFESNVFQIPASGSFSAPYRLVSLYTMATSGSVNQTYQLAAGLTGISRRNYPNIESVVGSGVGSDTFSTALLSKCVLWIDSSNISNLFSDVSRITNIVNVGDPIASISDLSLLRNAPVQDTASRRATYTSSTVGTLPAITFDGVDDFYATPSISTPNGTIYVVWKPISVPATFASPLSIKTSSVSTAVGGIICTYNFVSGKYTISSSDSITWTVTFNASAISNGTPALWSWSWGSSLSSITFRNNRVAGILSSSTGTYAQPTINPVFLGCGYSATKGGLAIGEALVFSEQHDIIKRTEIENYLKNKWGTP